MANHERLSVELKHKLIGLSPDIFQSKINLSKVETFLFF